MKRKGTVRQGKDTKEKERKATAGKEKERHGWKRIVQQGKVQYVRAVIKGRSDCLQYMEA